MKRKDTLIAAQARCRRLKKELANYVGRPGVPVMGARMVDLLPPLSSPVTKSVVGRVALESLRTMLLDDIRNLHANKSVQTEDFCGHYYWQESLLSSVDQAIRELAKAGK